MRITIISALFLLASLNLNAQADYGNKGAAKYSLGDYTGAIQDFNKALELDPDDGYRYYLRGNVKSDLGDKKGAIQDYSKAIELDPNDADAYGNRGSAKYDLGDKDGGCLDWSKSGELGDGDVYELIRKYCQ